MDLNILTELRQTATAGLAILGSLLLLYIAPGVPMAWLKKTLWMSVVIGVWMALVEPFRLELEGLSIYTLNVFVYPMLTERSAIMIYQAWLFLVTFKLFIWIFDIHAPQHHHGQSPSSSKN